MWTPTGQLHDALTQGDLGDLWPHDGEAGSCRCGTVCCTGSGWWEVEGLTPHAPDTSRGTSVVAQQGGQRRSSLPFLDPFTGPDDLSPSYESFLDDVGPRDPEDDDPRLQLLGRGQVPQLDPPAGPTVDPPVPPAGPDVSDGFFYPDVGLGHPTFVVGYDDPCPEPDGVGRADVVERLVDVDSFIAFQPTHQVNHNLIVMLPGASGRADRIQAPLNAMAQAGFRTIGLDWNLVDLGLPVEVPRGHARGFCVLIEQVSTDAELNVCLEEQRALKNGDPEFGVIPVLVSALQQLAASFPNDGWEEFLVELEVATPHVTGPITVPNWSRIVLAGYSEGAQQVAYNTRIFSPFGAIFVSSGGDHGILDLPTDLEGWVPTADELADYLTPLVQNRHHVGLMSPQEQHALSYGVAWDLNGVPATSSSVSSGPPFGDASRLEYTCEEDGVLCSPDAAHASTVPPTEEAADHPELREAYMYLACQAGRIAGATRP